MKISLLHFSSAFPQKTWRERIKEWFSRRKRYNQTKAGD